MAVFVATVGSLFLGPPIRFVTNDLGASVPVLGRLPALIMMLSVLLGLALGQVADRRGCPVLVCHGINPLSGAEWSRRLLDDYQSLFRHRGTLGLVGGSVLGNAGVWALLTYLGTYLVQPFPPELPLVGVQAMISRWPELETMAATR
jgi:hypothetical protein